MVRTFQLVELVLYFPRWPDTRVPLDWGQVLRRGLAGREFEEGQRCSCRGNDELQLKLGVTALARLALRLELVGYDLAWLGAVMPRKSAGVW